MCLSLVRQLSGLNRRSGRRGKGQEQEHSLFELLNGYKVLVKCSKNGTERRCEAEAGAGAGAWTGVRQDYYWPRC